MKARALLTRWGRRITATIVTAGALLVVGAPIAHAAADDGSGKLGQTPPSLAWITLTDSRGTSIWNYEMSLDRGGVMSPDRFFWASVTDSAWGIYRSGCALALWGLDWVLSFTWLQTVAAPLLALGDAMQMVVARMGLVVTFLTINALLAGMWMLRGRYATAIWEVGIAAVIAALAAGIFAHPVALIAGPNGYIVKASQVGQELATGLATGDATGRTPQQQRTTQTGQMVDTFIRQPTQMINFGRVLDGTPCESAYNEVIDAGPYGTGSQIRDQIADCDSELGEYAANPSSSMAIGSLVFMPAAFVILALALVLAGSVIAAALWAMFQSLKAVITLVTGLLPGGGRGSLMLTIAETVVALVVIVFASVFLSVFLLVVQALFAGSSGQSMPQTFVIVDVVIVAALMVYVRQHRQLKATSARLAGWLAHRPGGAPATRMPDRPLGFGGTMPTASAVRTFATVRQLQATRALTRNSQAAALPGAGPTYVDNRQQAMFFGTPPNGGSGPPSGSGEGPQVVPGEVIRDPGPPGPGSAGAPSSGRRPPTAGGGGAASRPGGRVSQAAGTLARAGTSAALAYATGGASTAVTATAKAARVAQTTRRVAVTAKLAAAAITSPPTPTPTSPANPAPASRRTPIALPPGPTAQATDGSPPPTPRDQLRSSGTPVVGPGQAPPRGDDPRSPAAPPANPGVAAGSSRGGSGPGISASGSPAAQHRAAAAGQEPPPDRPAPIHATAPPAAAPPQADPGERLRARLARGRSPLPPAGR